MTSRITAVIASLAAAAVLAAGPALAAQKPVSVSDMVTETFTIEAIDSTARIVTLKDKEGNLEEVFCGPEVQRFDALKVGDQVTFRYYESVVSAIRRPGTAPRPAEAGGITRAPGNRPGGTVSQQTTASVTIQAIDAKVPSVTVKSDRGRQMSFRVENAKNLEGYKVGDTVEITYTQALAVSVEPTKK
jgi:Cu/Ag efflux protein CusF